jgi:hypothetical protein
MIDFFRCVTHGFIPMAFACSPDESGFCQNVQLSLLELLIPIKSGLQKRRFSALCSGIFIDQP